MAFPRDAAMRRTCDAETGIINYKEWTYDKGIRIWLRFGGWRRPQGGFLMMTDLS